MTTVAEEVKWIASWNHYLSELDSGASWVSLGDTGITSAALRSIIMPITAIVGFEPVEDGTWWLHISISHKHRVPTYSEIKEVKSVFIGPNRKGIMVFPQESNYVNIHPYCLHLFSPLGRDPLPEFSRIENGKRIL